MNPISLDDIQHFPDYKTMLRVSKMMNAKAAATDDSHAFVADVIGGIQPEVLQYFCFETAQYVTPGLLGFVAGQMASLPDAPSDDDFQKIMVGVMSFIAAAYAKAFSMALNFAKEKPLP